MNTSMQGLKSTLSRSTGIAVILATLFTGSPVFAQPGTVVQLRDDYPSEYVVVEGDTLWDISGQFLEDPWLWPGVWEDNPQIENPHLIYPGDTVALRFEGGAPVLSLRRNETDLPTVRLSPRIRREDFTSPVPEIPLDAINSFLNAKRIIDSTEFENSARFLGTQSGTLMAATGDVIYARGDWINGVSRYDIVRQGEVFIDPVSEEEIGVEAELIGEAVLIENEGDQATLRVASTFQEVRAGDRIISRESVLVDPTFLPESPDFSVEARILQIGQGLVYGGDNDTLILNVGSRDNVAVGHLLTVQKPDASVRDEEAEEDLVFAGEKYASILVYRVFEKSSLALVLNSQGPIRMNDKVVTP